MHDTTRSNTIDATNSCMDTILLTRGHRFNSSFDCPCYFLKGNDNSNVPHSFVLKKWNCFRKISTTFFFSFSTPLFFWIEWKIKWSHQWGCMNSFTSIRDTWQNQCLTFDIKKKSPFRHLTFISYREHIWRCKYQIDKSNSYFITIGINYSSVLNVSL